MFGGTESMIMVVVGQYLVAIAPVVGSDTVQSTALYALLVGIFIVETLQEGTAAPHVAVPVGPLSGTEMVSFPSPLTI